MKHVYSIINDIRISLDPKRKEKSEVTLYGAHYGTKHPQEGRFKHDHVSPH